MVSIIQHMCACQLSHWKSFTSNRRGVKTTLRKKLQIGFSDSWPRPLYITDLRGMSNFGAAWPCYRNYGRNLTPRSHKCNVTFTDEE